MLDLPILYEDDSLIVINKPHNLPVHRSRMVSNYKVFALNLLRDQVGQYVYPIHRIDAKTSGVLAFAKNKPALQEYNAIFEERKVDKTYLALIRGWVNQRVIIRHPLPGKNGTLKESTTIVNPIGLSEINLPHSIWPTSRYSLVEAKPLTGRMHQIRKHLNHIRHPILGDRPHGCNKQNRLLKDTFALSNMMLHSSEIDFLDKNLRIHAGPSLSFNAMAKHLTLDDALKQYLQLKVRH